MPNTFPTRPILTTNPLPTWATAVGAVKADPGETKRGQGWIFNSTLNSGEIPRLDWVNNEAYNMGLWCTYFDQCATFLKNLIYPSDSSYPASNTSYCMVQSSTDSGNLSRDSSIPFQTISINTEATIPYDTLNHWFTAPITDHYKIDLNLKFVMKRDNGSPIGDDGQLFSVFETYPTNTAGNPNIRCGSLIQNTQANTLVTVGQPFTFRSRIIRKLNSGDRIRFTVADPMLGNTPGSLVVVIKAGSSISYSWKF